MKKFVLALMSSVLSVALWAAGLPEGYTELDWLQADGASWVYTGYRPACTDRVETKILFTSIASDKNQTIYCSRGSTASTATFTLFLVSGKLRPDRNTTSNQSMSPAPVVGEEYEIVVNGNTRAFSAIGSTTQITGTMASGTFTPGSVFSLFASHMLGDSLSASTVSSAMGNYGTFRLYYFRVYDAENTLKCEMIPCKNSSGAYGFYDTVAQVFRGSSGSGSLLSSAEISDIPFVVTNVWTSATGGYFSDTSKWKNGIYPGYYPTNPRTFIDFTALGSGEGVTNDIRRALPVAGITFSGSTNDTWIIGEGEKIKGGSGPFAFEPGGFVKVDGGTLTTGFNITPWGETINKRGTGTWRITADTWNRMKITAVEGTVLQDTSFYGTEGVVNGTNAVYAIGQGAPVAKFAASGKPGEQVKMNGYNFYLNAANGSSEVISFSPTTNLFSGSGSSGVAPINVSRMTINNPQGNFSGNYRIMNGSTVFAGRESDILAFYRFNNYTECPTDSSVYEHTLTWWQRPLCEKDPERGNVFCGVLSDGKTGNLLGTGKNNSNPNLPTGNEPFTVGLWLKVATNCVKNAGVFSWGLENGNTNQGAGAFLRLQRDGKGTSGSGTTGNVGYLMFTNYGNNTYFGETNTVDGSWHHIGIVCGTNGVVRCYVDGELAAENHSLSVRDINVNASFSLGFSKLTYSYMHGWLDDFIVVRGEVNPRILMDMTTPDIASFSKGAIEHNPSAKIFGALSGEIKFEDGHHTFGGLAGTGPFARIEMGDGLTIARESGSDVLRSEVCGAGDFVKGGGKEYTLIAEMPLNHSGNTRVEGGTLALARLDGAYRGVVGEWLFNNPDNFGEDSSGMSFQIGNLVGKSEYGGATGVGSDIVTDEERGNVLQLDGVSVVGVEAGGYPAAFPLGDMPHSFSMWIKVDEDCADTAGLISWGRWWSGGKMIICRLEANDGISINVNNDGSTKKFTNVGLRDGKWHLVAYTYENLASVLYIDGEAVSDWTRDTPLDIQKYSYFGLGRDFHCSKPTSFKGRIDNARVYNFALSAEEVACEYRKGTSPIAELSGNNSLIPEPVVRYDFEDESNPGLDRGSHGVNLTSVGPVSTAVVAGRSGRVLNLNASEMCYLTAPQFPLGIIPTGVVDSVSISVWYRVGDGMFPGRAASTNYSPIVDWGDSSAFYYLSLNNEHRPTPNFIMNSWMRFRSTWLDTTFDYQKDMWHHLVVTRGRGSKHAYVYLDGTRIAASGDVWWYGCGEGKYFYVGHTHFNNTQWFHGYLDDLEIFNCELSADQVSRMCAKGSGKYRENILPANSGLTVDKNAIVEVRGTTETISTLNGEGDVLLSAHGRLIVQNASGFAGEIIGSGSAEIKDGLVLEDDGNMSNSCILSRPNGKVVIPATGTIKFNCPASQVRGGRYVIARGNPLVLPSDFSGWTVSATSGEVKYRFSVVGNEFRVIICSGMTVIVR